MSTPDFNLLLTLDAVLSEGSVAGAARRLRLSPSAMSRALARLRETTGDPLLVRAGRGLAPTPRALALREQVGQLVQEARSVLRPADTLDLARLSRTFVLRTREGIVENFGAALIACAARQAPGVRLCFLPKGDKENSGLRDGTVDLETGVVGALAGPEIRIQTLFRDRYVGVVRRAHALAGKSATLARYLQASHIAISRRARERGPVDDALQLLARERCIGTVVGGFSAALALARETDLVATVPERHTGKLRKGMHTFDLPFDMAPLTISLLWHPRQHADPAHQWLRALMLDVCRNEG